MKRPLLAALAGMLLAPQPGATQTEPHECYRGRPLPICSSFWITEFALMGPLPNRFFPYGRVMRWQVGGMSNHGARNAIGATLVLGLDDVGTSYGLTPRYRRWLSPGVALDVSAGVLLRGCDGLRVPSFVAQTGVTTVTTSGPSSRSKRCGWRAGATSPGPAASNSARPWASWRASFCRSGSSRRASRRPRGDRCNPRGSPTV